MKNVDSANFFWIDVHAQDIQSSPGQRRGNAGTKLAQAEDGNILDLLHEIPANIKTDGEASSAKPESLSCAWSLLKLLANRLSAAYVNAV